MEKKQKSLIRSEFQDGQTGGNLDSPVPNGMGEFFVLLQEKELPAVPVSKQKTSDTSIKKEPPELY